MSCLQAIRAALDAQALQVMPPALAKKLIKGGRLLGSLQTPACWCVHAGMLLLARQPPRCCGLLPCPAVHGMHSTRAELQTTSDLPATPAYLGQSALCKGVGHCLPWPSSVSCLSTAPPVFADLRQSALRKGRLPWYTRSLRVAKTAAFSEATWWTGEIPACRLVAT